MIGMGRIGLDGVCLICICLMVIDTLGLIEEHVRMGIYMLSFYLTWLLCACKGVCINS